MFVESCAGHSVDKSLTEDQFSVNCQKQSVAVLPLSATFQYSLLVLEFPLAVRYFPVCAYRRASPLQSRRHVQQGDKILIAMISW